MLRPTVSTLEELVVVCRLLPMLRPAHGAVRYSAGVGCAFDGGQVIVTYAAPSVQGAVTYSGGVCGGQEAATNTASSV